MNHWRYVFVDIDTQRDFMDPTGALYVPGAEDIVPNLERLVRTAAAHKIPLLSSADNHSSNDPEFAQFPPHCLRGTSGQAKLPETLLDHRTIVEPRDAIKDPASLLRQHDQIIFYKTEFDVFANPSFSRLIGAIDVDMYVVFGVAKDYCVRSAALGLRRAGQRVLIVSDAIRAVDLRTGQQAHEELTHAGVEWTLTERVVNKVMSSE